MAATLAFPWAASPTKPSRLTYHLHCSEAPPESTHLLLQLCQAVGDREVEERHQLQTRGAKGGSGKEQLEAQWP